MRVNGNYVNKSELKITHCKCGCIVKSYPGNVKVLLHECIKCFRARKGYSIN